MSVNGADSSHPSPALGTEVTVVVGAHLGGRDWEGAVSALDARKVIVTAPPGVTYRPGEELQAWVSHGEPAAGVVRLTVADFGRRPISPAMRPRYLQALADVDQMLVAAERGKVALAPAASVSEFKGMVNRCLRKDQADWLSVYGAFGFSSRATVEDLSNVLAQLQRAVKAEASPAILLDILLVLDRRGLGRMIARARAIIAQAV